MLAKLRPYRWSLLLILKLVKVALLMYLPLADALTILALMGMLVVWAWRRNKMEARQVEL